MLPNDKQEFSNALTACLETYDKKVTSSILNIYWITLEKYKLKDVLNAISLHMQDPDAGRFAPKPAHLISRFRGTGGSEALLAWSKVDEAVRRVGPYQSVCFDDPIIHRVIVDMGGWPAMNNKEESEWPFTRNEFEKRYHGYSLQGGIPADQIPKLNGIGTLNREPILIGDSTKARDVNTVSSDKPRVELRHISDVMKTLGDK